MGTQPCNTLRPYKQNGVQYIYSTFSPKQLEQGYSLVKCPASGRLINCLNKLCVVDPNNPTKSICYCSPQNSGSSSYWVTQKKNDEPCSCNNLSGATANAFNSTVNYWKQCLNINILKLN